MKKWKAKEERAMEQCCPIRSQKASEKDRGSQDRTKSSQRYFAVFFILARARHASGKWISHKALYCTKLNISAKYALKGTCLLSRLYISLRLLTKSEQLNTFFKSNIIYIHIYYFFSYIYNYYIFLHNYYRIYVYREIKHQVT